MARIFFVTIFALLVGTLLALKPTVQELQSAKQAAIGKLNTLWGVKPSDLQIVQQEGRRLQAASGWMFATTYSGDECHGAKRADIVVGFAADVCLSTKREAGIPARSFIFTCTESKSQTRFQNIF
ncbi:hypothetical protein EON65_28110 [archaeon]|nr:MAG: hypothetical protein EON65_28110 [archaeon]